MRKRWKRVLSFVLSVSLAIGMTPMASFAAPGEQEESQQSGFTEMALDTSYPVDLGENEYWVGSFTAAEKGYYVFFSEGDGDSFGTLYSDAELENELSSDDDGGSVSNFRIRYELDAGETVYLMAKEYYGRTITCSVKTVRFNEKDLAYGGLRLNSYEYALTGQPIVLDAAVVDFEGNVLAAGTDYEFVYVDQDEAESTTAPSEEGFYYVYASAIGDTYTGKTNTEGFQIVDVKDLSNGKIVLNKDIYFESDEPVKVDAIVSDYDKNVLTEGTDYELVFLNEDYEELDSAPSKAGFYYVYARAIGDTYSGKVRSYGSFYIVDAYDIGDNNWFYYISGTQSYEYTGDPVIPSDLSIYWYDYDNDERVYLEKDTEYKLDHYEDRKEHQLDAAPSQVGSYYAVYSGIEPYKGTYKDSFRILGDGYDLTLSYVELFQTEFDYTGEPVDPEFVVYDVNLGDHYSTELDLVYYDSEGTELENAPSETGEYQVAARGKAGTDFTGETPKVSLRICGNNDLGNTRFYCRDGKRVVFAGEPVSPPDHNIYDNETDKYLTVDTDYVFSHIETTAGQNVGSTVAEKGGYYVVYDGTGDFTGSKKVYFYVVDYRDLSYAAYPYSAAAPLVDGVAILPKFAVEDAAGNELIEGTDYEFDHINSWTDKVLPTKPGWYNVYYKGLGDYTGKFYVEMHVYDPNDLDSFTATFTNGSSIELGSATLPSVSIYRDDDNNRITLTEGTDYVFDRFESYNGDPLGTDMPQKVGSYYAYFKGTGDYTGEIQVYFEIFDTKDLNNWSITCTTSSWIEVGAATLPAPMVYRYGNVDERFTLAEGEDYQLDHIAKPASFGEEEEDLGTVIPAEAGEYYAYYKGINGYSNTLSITFNVYDPFDLDARIEWAAYWNGSFSPTDYIELGTTEFPVPTICHWTDDDQKITLTEETDYVFDRLEDENGTTLEKAVPQAVGSYYAYYKGTGKYKGEKAIYFTVFDPKDISNWDIAYITGREIELGSTTLPESMIYRQDANGNTLTLTEGKEYVLDYIEDVNGTKTETGVPQTVGSYDAYYSGINGYTGTKQIHFCVYDPKDLTATVGNGNYYWRCSFDSTIELGTTELPEVRFYNYDGDPGSRIYLVEGTDFALDHFEDENGADLGTAVPQTVGYYTALYKGINQYTGSRWLGFNVIDPMDLQNWDGTFGGGLGGCIIDLGDTELPAPTISRNNTTLVEGIDYTFDHFVDGNDRDLGSEFPDEVGWYYAYYKGIGEYTGMCGIEFEVIDPGNIRYWNGSFEPSDWIEVGSEDPTPTFTRKGETLTYGVDFTFDHVTKEVDRHEEVVEGFPKEAGHYYAYYKGIGDYTGTASIYFHIYDLNDLSAEVEWEYYWEAVFSPGKPLELGVAEFPTPKIYRDGVSLIEGTDYEFDHIEDRDGESYEKAVPTVAGGYYAYYKGIGKYTGMRHIYFSVFDPKDISNWDAYLVGGGSIKLGTTSLPASEFYRWVNDREGQVTLAEGTDYALDHIEDEDGNDCGDKIPEKAGDYYAYYKGIGDYTGTRSIRFEVYDPYDLDSIWSSQFAGDNYIELGATTLPAALIYTRDENDPHANVVLAEGTDYELSRIEDEDENDLGKEVPLKTGGYYAVYSGKAPYYGEKYLWFEVYRSNDLGNGRWHVSFKNDTGIYATGSPVQLPEAVIKSDDGQVLLREGTDFKLVRYEEYDENADNYRRVLEDAPVESGEYCVVYQGMGDYEGELSLWFWVTDLHSLDGRSLRLAEDYVAFTGKPVELEVTITDQDGVTVDPSEYELVYLDDQGFELADGAPSAVGSYRVCARAKDGGNYKGKTYNNSFTIISMGEAITASLDTAIDVSVAQNEAKRIAFTAPKAGKYVFFSEGASDSYGRLYSDADLKNRLAQNDDGGEGVNFMIVQELKAGQTVYLAVHACDYGTISTSVTVTSYDAMDLANASFKTDYSNMTSVGTLWMPVITIKDASGTVLKSGTHYKLAYALYDGDTYKPVETPTKAGEYRVVASAIAGSGYTNQIYGYITIYSDYDIARATITRKEQYKLGEDVAAAISLTDRSGKKLQMGTDYELLFYEETNGVSKRLTSAPTTEGYYFVYAKALGSTYTGETGTMWFTIYDPHDLSSYGYIELLGYGYTEYDGIPVYQFTGTAVKPEIEVQYNGQEISSDAYTVSYANNAAATEGGKFATVTITGKAPYTGSQTAYFVLEAKSDINSLVSTNSLEIRSGDFGQEVYGDTKAIRFPVSKWTGSPEITLKDQTGNALAEGKDYTISYATENGTKLDKAPTAAGKYQMIITAVDGSSFTGEFKVRFVLAEIAEEDIQNILISGAKIALDTASCAYDGKVKNPKIKSVVVDGKTLTEDDDYRITAMPVDCLEIGTYTFTITGRGRYTGTATATFEIKKGTSGISLADQAKKYNGKSRTYTGTVTKSGSEGEVTYTYYSDAKGTKQIAKSQVKAVGTYYVKATLAADAHYEAATSNLAKFTIKPDGWTKIDGKYYYYKSGKKLTGWQTISGKKYYFATDGSMQKGWKQIDKKWYYFASGGAMQKDWKQIGGKWYYLGTDGVMQTGWVLSGKYYYYLKKDGTMAANEYCQGYWLNKDGSWTYKRKATWRKDKTGWWFGDGKWYAKSTTLTIDGKQYSFNSKGYQK